MVSTICSPSPTTAASMKSAIGSGLNAACPPAITIGCSSPRSTASSGMPARSSAVSRLVYPSSVAKLTPNTSNAPTGRCPSTVNCGISCSRISRSMSGQTEYVRSHRTPSCSLRISYRIWMPWLGSPTSYASGYIRHHRTSQASQSLTWELSSPPTYWIGFCTSGSSGSRRSNSDSTGMGKALRQWIGSAALRGTPSSADVTRPGHQTRSDLDTILNHRA